MVQANYLSSWVKLTCESAIDRYNLMMASEIQFQCSINEYVFKTGEKDDILYIEARHPQETYLFVLNLEFHDLPDNAKKYFENSQQIAHYISREGSNAVNFQGGIMTVKFQSASKTQKQFELTLRKINLSHFDMNAIIEEKNAKLQEEVRLRVLECERRMESERRQEGLKEQLRTIKQQFCQSETQCARLFGQVDQLQDMISIAQAASCCESCPVHGFGKQAKMQAKLQGLNGEIKEARGIVGSAEETVRKAEEAVRLTKDQIKKNQQKIRQREQVINKTTEQIRKLQEESLRTQEEIHNLESAKNQIGEKQIQVNAQIALIKEQNQRNDNQAVFSYKNVTAATMKEIVSIKWNELHALSLNGNKLREEGVTLLTTINWPHLRRLDLANNSISQLIWKPKNLSKLTKLILYVNSLKEIPGNITELAELQILFLDSNELTRVPPQLAALPHLEKLQIHQNRISNIDKDLVMIALLAKGVQCLDLSQK